MDSLAGAAQTLLSIRLGFRELFGAPRKSSSAIAARDYFYEMQLIWLGRQGRRGCCAKKGDLNKVRLKVPVVGILTKRGGDIGIFDWYEEQPEVSSPVANSDVKIIGGSGNGSQTRKDGWRDDWWPAHPCCWLFPAIHPLDYCRLAKLVHKG